MARTVGIGIQNFDEIIENNYFYVDKTHFIKEWWEGGDSVTLITRPRRFGKTLTMSMVKQFFSLDYAGRADLFEGLSIWQEEKFRALQGTYPVISLSFANIKESNYLFVYSKICQVLYRLYLQNLHILDDERIRPEKKEEYRDMMACLKQEEHTAKISLSLNLLSELLYDYYGKKVIILLDEYDTPMQEAYVDGFWDELTAFTRSLFNSTFKTNPWLGRAIMTGITRVSKESIFSDLNNLEVVTTTSDKYADCFGFTEQEVFDAMDEIGRTEKQQVKEWYDGFTFGKISDIYNPWSILSYLNKGKLTTYWANTSSNSLVSKLIREGRRGVKQSFELLLNGEHLYTPIDEQIVYSQLNGNAQAIWSLLLASGYLKVISYQTYTDVSDGQDPEYELALTNYEVQLMFRSMVKGWFAKVVDDYNDFIRALLEGDLEGMNVYMNQVALATFSYFDTGAKSSGAGNPENFYHGFVLGLMVDLRDRYVLTSNRESGFGRYDILLEPLSQRDDAIIIEFKVYNSRREQSLEETLQNALQQIEDKKYEGALLAKGIPAERIRKYGFAFQGKEVLIG